MTPSASVQSLAAKRVEGAGTWAKGVGAASVGAGGANVLKRKARRRNHAQPERGLSLLVSAFVRLELWQDFWSAWTCRTFGTVLSSCLPRLAKYVQAERFAEGVLRLVVSSSAVASELSFVRDVLLEQVNARLLVEYEKLPQKHRRLLRPVLRLEHRVGKLPAVALSDEQGERRGPPKRAVRSGPSVATQLEVASACQNMADEELRHLLIRWVGSAGSELLDPGNAYVLPGH